jgi:hypothetical protein
MNRKEKRGSTIEARKKEEKRHTNKNALGAYNRIQCQGTISNYSKKQ